MPVATARLLLRSSALLWLVGSAFLLIALLGRADGGPTHFSLWGRRHDVAIAVAAVFVAGAAWGMRDARTSSDRHLGAGIAWLGMLSGLTTAVLLALIFVSGASDMLYMLPQGGIGLWLIAVCDRKLLDLGSGTRALGFLAGTGLFLIAISFVMIASALGPALVTLVDARSVPVSPEAFASPLNARGHIALKIGSLIGLPLYPIWAWLASGTLRQSTTEK